MSRSKKIWPSVFHLPLQSKPELRIYTAIVFNPKKKKYKKKWDSWLYTYLYTLQTSKKKKMNILLSSSVYNDISHVDANVLASSQRKSQEKKTSNRRKKRKLLWGWINNEKERKKNCLNIKSTVVDVVPHENVVCWLEKYCWSLHTLSDHKIRLPWMRWMPSHVSCTCLGISLPCFPSYHNKSCPFLGDGPFWIYLLYRLYK